MYLNLFSVWDKKSAKWNQVGVRGLSFTRFFGRLGDAAGGVELGRFLYHNYSCWNFYISSEVRNICDVFASDSAAT